MVLYLGKKQNPKNESDGGLEINLSTSKDCILIPNNYDFTPDTGKDIAILRVNEETEKQILEFMDKQEDEPKYKDGAA